MMHSIAIALLASILAQADLRAPIEQSPQMTSRRSTKFNDPFPSPRPRLLEILWCLESLHDRRCQL